jgi:hypothetical protein
MVHQVPKPQIYLRNKFNIKPGLHGLYFRGQEELLKHLEPNVELIAACGSGKRPLLETAPPPTRLPRMMHVWKMPEWETLYKLMWTFSESDWYTIEVSSLQVEHQDLLVGIGHSLIPEPRDGDWVEGESEYIYVYQELRLNTLLTRLRYLMHLNWVIANVKDKGWHLQWVAAEVTGTPSQICILWRVDREDLVEETLNWLATDEDTRDRYAQMMLGIATFYQDIMAPESTEAIDNRMPSRRPKIKGAKTKSAKTPKPKAKGAKTKSAKTPKPKAKGAKAKRTGTRKKRSL